MTILNLTQHPATEDQLLAGVVEPLKAEKKDIKSLLTFTDLPVKEQVVHKAVALAYIAKGCGADAAMIGGAPYLMPELAKQLKDVGIKPLFSFTERVVQKEVGEDGNVVKTSIFKHQGFVEA